MPPPKIDDYRRELKYDDPKLKHYYPSAIQPSNGVTIWTLSYSSLSNKAQDVIYDIRRERLLPGTHKRDGKRFWNGEGYLPKGGEYYEFSALRLVGVRPGGVCHYFRHGKRAVLLHRDALPLVFDEGERRAHRSTGSRTFRGRRTGPKRRDPASPSRRNRTRKVVPRSGAESISSFGAVVLQHHRHERQPQPHAGAVALVQGVVALRGEVRLQAVAADLFASCRCRCPALPARPRSPSRRARSATSPFHAAASISLCLRRPSCGSASRGPRRGGGSASRTSRRGR